MPSRLQNLSIPRRNRDTPIEKPGSPHKKICNQQGEMSYGAQKKTRTSTTARPLDPESSASTNSAIWALITNIRMVTIFTDPCQWSNDTLPARLAVGKGIGHIGPQSKRAATWIAACAMASRSRSCTKQLGDRVPFFLWASVHLQAFSRCGRMASATWCMMSSSSIVPRPMHRSQGKNEARVPSGGAINPVP